MIVEDLIWFPVTGTWIRSSVKNKKDLRSGQDPRLDLVLLVYMVNHLFSFSSNKLQKTSTLKCLYRSVCGLFRPGTSKTPAVLGRNTCNRRTGRIRRNRNIYLLSLSDLDTKKRTPSVWTKTPILKMVRFPFTPLSPLKKSFDTQ